MALLRAIAHKVFGKVLDCVFAGWVLADLLVSKRKRKIRLMTMVKSTDSLGILLYIVVFARKSGLLAS